MTENSGRLLLDWAGPYHWVSRRGPTIFSGPYAESTGLYLWCVAHRDTYLVYYVGQTEAGFGKRHYQHFRDYCGGSYTIHQADTFRSGKHHRLYQTKTYARDPWRRVQPFIDRFPELSQNLAGILDAMAIFVAPLEQPRRVHRRLEAAISDLLYAAEPESIRFQEPGMAVHRRRDDEPWIDVLSRPKGLFLGLRDSFRA